MKKLTRFLSALFTALIVSTTFAMGEFQEQQGTTDAQKDSEFVTQIEKEYHALSPAGKVEVKRRISALDQQTSTTKNSSSKSSSYYSEGFAQGQKWKVMKESLDYFESEIRTYAGKLPSNENEFEREDFKRGVTDGAKPEPFRFFSEMKSEN